MRTPAGPPLPFLCSGAGGSSLGGLLLNTANNWQSCKNAPRPGIQTQSVDVLMFSELLSLKVPLFKAQFLWPVQCVIHSRVPLRLTL